MTMTMPKGSGPLILGVVAIGALWFFSRRAAAASAPGGALPTPVRRPDGTSRDARYATPTNSAESLARVGIALWRGLMTAAPDAGVAVGSADARRAVRTSDPDYYGWSGPTSSVVDPIVSPVYGDPSSYGMGAVDSVLGAPVYDVGVDLTQPWLYYGDGP